MIVEVIKKGFFAGAPVQKPEVITAEVEAAEFKFQEMVQYKVFGVFFFNKK